LKAGNVRSCRFQPIEEIPEPLIEVVDVEGGDFHSEAWLNSPMVIDLMRAVMSSHRIGDAPSSALLGGHHVDIARYEEHLLAPAFEALQFQRVMLADGFDTFKLLPAFLATILVGRHGLR